LAIEPFEAAIRERIGSVVAVDALAEAPAQAAELMRDPDAFRNAIRQARADNVFNVGTSGRVASDVIEAKAGAYLRVNGLAS
jgi:hypothetical protein